MTASIGTTASKAAPSNATTMRAACRSVNGHDRSVHSPANAATRNPAVTASTAARLMPISQNSGSATTLWTAQPSDGAHSQDCDGAATRATIGRPIKVQIAVIAMAQSNAFPSWAI
jgi:hypothetical protein